jgi:GTP-binding protein
MECRPDIVAVCAHPVLQIGETICSPEAPVALPTIQVEEPTVSMTFKVGTPSVCQRRSQHSRLRTCLLADRQGRSQPAGCVPT